MTKSVLQGESFPISNSPCGYAYIELFTPNDNCSDAVVKFFSGDHSEFASLFYGDCPDRFHYYATACSDEDDNDGIAEVNIAYTFCVYYLNFYCILLLISLHIYSGFHFL